MSFDLEALMRARGDEKFPLFEHHLNGQLVRVLKTIGFDIGYVRGEGAHLYDGEGRRYLDHLSGFGVFAMGRNHPKVIDALKQVLEGQLAGMVQLDVSLLAGLLAERLNGYMPWLEKLYFCNSGAEAVEAALKFARSATGRSKVIYCGHGYHGLTYGALSVTSDSLFRQGFTPLLGDCIEIPFNDLLSLERELAQGGVAAFIVEPIQGKGVNLPHDDYLAEAARLCRRHKAVFIADEIQSGLGRSGRFLASEHWGVEPDIVTLAKSLSGGFVPVGAVACRRWIFDKVFDRMDRAVVHGSTFSKNDMAMAAGLASLEVLEEENLIQRAEDLGRRLQEELRRRLSFSEFVHEVRGKGLMIGLELRAPKSLRLKTAYAMIEQARKGLFCQLLLIPLLTEHRLLAQVAGSDLPVIKLLPALVLDEADVEWTVAAFEAVLKDAQSLGGIWELGRTLVGHALQSRAGAA